MILERLREIENVVFSTWLLIIVLINFVNINAVLRMKVKNLKDNET